jgi:hypothetical protein
MNPGKHQHNLSAKNVHSDQAFLVSNHDRNGGRLLDAITLRCEKSRYGLSDKIEYRYESGKMRRLQAEAATSKTVTERLRDLLIANPGILTHHFENLTNEEGLGRNRARDFLKEGTESGTIKVRKEGRKRYHSWLGVGAEADDPQQPIDG